LIKKQNGKVRYGSMSLLPVPKKFKVTPSAGKVMATVFWDSQGVIMTNYLSKGSTVPVHISYEKHRGASDEES